MKKLNTVSVVENHSLRDHNTFHIDAKARYFTSIHSEKDIFELLSYKELKTLPHLIIGGGSNILLTKDFPGLVAHNRLLGKQIINEDDEFNYVEAAAGEEWHGFVLWTLDQGLSGLENLSLIPGTVGASPIQNIGAYGVELKDYFDRLTAIEKSTGHIRLFDASDCKFGYRESIFKRQLKDQLIITSVRFKLPKRFIAHTSYGEISTELKQTYITHPSAKDISDAVCRIRKRKLPDPRLIGNAGSFFKNPIIPLHQLEQLKKIYTDLPNYAEDQSRVKIPAAWLIERSGWKGKSLGNASVHERHALVLVNREDKASGAEILALAQAIQASVENEFGIVLEPEPVII